jgi:hypothetical protein
LLVFSDVEIRLKVGLAPKVADIIKDFRLLSSDGRPSLFDYDAEKVAIAHLAL